MDAPPRPDPASALRLGRRWFLSARRIDMSALAEALGVNRVTLYRWFGSRDRFMVEVLWSLADQTLANLLARTTQTGPDRIVTIAVEFLRQVIDNPGMQRWLHDEGEHAMRLLTRHEPGFQPRLIARIDEIIQAEAAAGRLSLPIDLHELAYVVVRLAESYLYLDLITGERPDARRAEAPLKLLLRLD